MMYFIQLCRVGFLFSIEHLLVLMPKVRVDVTLTDNSNYEQDTNQKSNSIHPQVEHSSTLLYPKITNFYPKFAP